MKILLATTTFDGKKYCFDKWFDAVKKIDYPDLDVLLVDNSDNDEYAKWLCSRGVKAIHLDLDIVNDNFYKMAKTTEYIRELFVNSDYDYWFSLETDVLVPPNILKVLTTYKADWVGVCYRGRGGLSFAGEFGCSLFSKNIMRHLDFKDVPRNFTHDSWFDGEKFRYSNFTKIVLYNFLDIKHL